MNITIDANSLRTSTPNFFSFSGNFDFSEAIRSDEELLFYIQAFIKASSIQLDRIENNYFYDQIEYGDILESLSERPTQLSINQVIGLIKSLAKCSYYSEEVYILYKKCLGHFNERVKSKAHFRNNEHIQKEEEKILNTWRQKEGIKPESIKIRRHIYRNLTGMARFCDFYMDYTHIDNFEGCSHPHFKNRTIQNASFESVIQKFENKIRNCGLEYKKEWSKLAKCIFGDNLMLTD